MERIKIVFNSQTQNAAATVFYREAFTKLTNISFQNYENYQKYDVALFMAFDQDLHDAVVAKKQNPKLKIGIIDARTPAIGEVSTYIDFFISDSLEVSDFVARYQKPIFTYHEYPNVPIIQKQHIDKTPIIIGYHGNRAHLDGIYPHITQALEFLGAQYSLELWVMYNIKELGEWKFGLPRNINVRHIQWNMENYQKKLSQADIGIVPAFMPIRKLSTLKRKAVVEKKIFSEQDFDYLLRFKSSSNFGRIIVFSKLGVPVVADMIPSSVEAIKNGYDGELVYSAGAWVMALEKLIQSASLRQLYANRLQEKLLPKVDFINQNNGLLEFLENLIKQPAHERLTFHDPREKEDFTYPIWKGKMQQLLEKIKIKVKS